MNDLPRQKLCEIIAEHGPSLCDDHGRCEGLLRDYCPHDRGKVNVLVNALKERVVADLINGTASVPLELLLGRLAKRLEEHHAMREDMALWAVESWALALGRSACPAVQLSDESVNAAAAEAAKLYRAIANKGDASAQFNLGFCYAIGRGVTKDEVEAARWYRKAADQGDAEAQMKLGNCYAFGRGVAEDDVEAVRWYCKAADQGYAEAQFNMGYCYEMGSGVVEDRTEAVRWYRKAADQGYASAQFRLGFCYAGGRGVVKDDVEAVRWYRKAADQGYAEAQFNMGYCYEMGRGVVEDRTEAVQWYRKVVDKADAQTAGYDSWDVVAALFSLGHLGENYANGRELSESEVCRAKCYRYRSRNNH